MTDTPGLSGTVGTCSFRCDAPLLTKVFFFLNPFVILTSSFSISFFSFPWRCSRRTADTCFCAWISLGHRKALCGYAVAMAKHYERNAAARNAGRAPDPYGHIVWFAPPTNESRMCSIRLLTPRMFSQSVIHLYFFKWPMSLLMTNFFFYGATPTTEPAFVFPESFLETNARSPQLCPAL